VYKILCNNYLLHLHSHKKEAITTTQNTSFNSQECYGECSNFDYTNSDHFYSSSPSTLINSPNQKQRSVRRCMCGIYEREMKRGVDEEIGESD
jgi:hypothetical protein